MALQLLIVEENPSQRDQWMNLCRAQGHRVFAFADFAGASEALDVASFDLALLSFANPKACLELQRALKSRYPSCQVTLLTERPPDEAEARLLESGARSVLFRPLGADALGQLVTRVAGHRRRRVSRGPDESCLDSMVGQAPALLELKERIRKVAASATTSVLITGESGTGKELAARAVHLCGPRAAGPFIEVNCAAIPASLLESELFGYEPGAFTHAVGSKPGLFELATGGTIFLDEIGELSSELQAKLLRVLDGRTVRRLGGQEELVLDVRVVAATNRDLLREVDGGSFRMDLFHRLSVVPVHLPPLRERPGDITLIARHYLQFFDRKFGRPAQQIEAAVLKRMEACPWPGNVRQLANLMEQAVLMHHEPVLGPDAFPTLFLEAGEPATTGRITARIIEVDFSQGPICLEHVEHSLIEKALEAASGNISQAARLLGLGRGALRHRLTALGIEPGLRRAG